LVKVAQKQGSLEPLSQAIEALSAKLVPLHYIVPRTSFPMIYGSPKMDSWIRRYDLLKIKSSLALKLRKRVH